MNDVPGGAHDDHDDHDDHDVDERGRLLTIVRTAWEERDPMPEGLIARMQAAAALASAELSFEDELMLLVERSTQLAGTRGATAAYTLRFAAEGHDLLLRIATTGEGARIDGWVVPAEPMTVEVLRTAGGADGTVEGSVAVNENGRFELLGLAAGMLRIRLRPHDPAATGFVTPTFEI